MRKLIIWAVAALCAPCWAATYYVSSSSGSDANPGTQTQPFQTLAKVNELTLNPGDSVFLKRGDTWNEQLIPPSSGTSDNPITFDAYGTGAAPVLTPVISLAGATWTHNSGNIYTTTVSTTIASPQINDLQLGSVWGRKRSASPGCTSAGVILGYGDFCVVYPTLYIYSPNGTSPSTYYSSIIPVVGQASGLSVVSVVSKGWLVFQHMKLQTFDYMGVSVTGTSDNLVFANMESDGMVPYGTTPHGFYVDAPSAANIQFLNDDAHLNYDGFRVDGATGVTVINCRGYANRDAGLKDGTGSNPSPVTYSYSHFYGNNIAQFPTSDVAWNTVVPAIPGPIAGSGNISSSIAPAVANFKMYPARFSFTVDDVGLSKGTEAYINSMLTVFSSRGLYFNAAIVPSYAGQSGQDEVWTSANSWYASGNEIDSHSWSHQYYTTNGNPQGSPPYPNSGALNIQYVGSGTAATMTITGNVLATTVTGTPADSIAGINLATSPYNTAQGLVAYLQTLPAYSVSFSTDEPVVSGSSDLSAPTARPNTHTVNLATIASPVDIKTAPYVMLYDQTKLVPDELASSKAALQANIPGLSESFYVYPAGIEDPSTEADAVAAGFTAARGSLAMKDQANNNAGANSVYSNGVNIQNITSLGAIQIHGMSQAQISQMAASLVFRAAAWGVPYGFFTHYNSRGDNTPDISNTELGDLLDAVTANGGIWMTNMALAAAVSSGTQISGTTRYIQGASGGAVNLAVAEANSPTVGRGIGTLYPVDLNGTNRATLGAWDIGASAYLSQRYGSGAGVGSSYVGWPVASPAVAMFSAGLLGGVAVTVNNPNGDPTVTCFTTDGVTQPRTAGDGKTCSAGETLQPYTAYEGHKPNYFTVNQTASLQIVAGISGGADSSVTSYPVTVATQTIAPYHFGFECGFSTNECEKTASPVAVQWPTSTATPTLLRLHDSHTWWAAIDTGSGYSWTYLDAYLDMAGAQIAAGNNVILAEQFTATPLYLQPSGSSCGQVLAVYAPTGTNCVPSDLTAGGSPSFNNFVYAFVTHCSAAGNCVGQCPSGNSCVHTNLVKIFQLWNEWDLNVHWTGTMQQVYQMVAPAAAIIRANVPNAVLTMPSVTSGSTTTEADFANWLTYENANGRISDYADFHSYMSATFNYTLTSLSNSSGVTTVSYTGGQQMVPGETIGVMTSTNSAYLGYYTVVSATSSSATWAQTCSTCTAASGTAEGMNNNTPEATFANQIAASGATAPTLSSTAGWNVAPALDSEVGFNYLEYTCLYSSSPIPPLSYSETDCAGMPARWQILHASYGLPVWWYKWVLSIVDNDPGAPVSYQTVYKNLQSLLMGGYFSGHGSIPGGTSCATYCSAPFVESNGTHGLWVWTDSESGYTASVPGGYVDYKDLLGDPATPITSGQNLALTVLPILLEQ